VRNETDGTGARRTLPLLNGDAISKLAFGDQLSARIEAKLPGYHQQRAGLHIGHVICNRCGGRGQRYAEFREAPFDSSRHDVVLLLKMAACVRI